MKFKKLAIRNYRGVRESSVEFADSGITLIQGPNEAGKTSLATSINILFKHKATANHKDVRDIRPVHRDANPEIELEAESGGWHFVYAKTFQPRNGSATLSVLAPEQANFTADAAHDKANQILRDTLDKDLWDALIVRQGEMIDIPNLSGKAALMSALDSAAGGGATDEHSESVFELAEREYARYYNKNGSEKDWLVQAAADLAEARERAETLETALRDLDRKVERVAALRKRTGELASQMDTKNRELAARQAIAADIAAITETLNRERLDRQSAEAESESARHARTERERLVKAAAQAEAALAVLVADGEKAAPELASAGERRREAKEFLDRAERAKAECEAALAVARADFDYFNDKLHRDMMRERNARIEEARRDAAAAARELAENAVGEAVIAEMKKAAHALDLATAQFKTEAAKTTLTALSNCRIDIGGETVELPKGTVIDRTVADTLRLIIPGVIEIQMESGYNSSQLAENAAMAQTRLDALFARARVADLDAAFAACEKRKQAEKCLRDCRESEKTALRDLEYDDFCQRLRALEIGVAEYPARRGNPETLPADLDAAKAAKERMEAEHGRIFAELCAAREAHASAGAVHDNLVSRHKEALIRKEVAEKTLRQCAAELASARNARPDAELAAAVEAAAARAAELADAVKATEAALLAKNPDKNRVMLETLAGSLQSLRDQHADCERELAGLQAELAVRGEAGLFEELQAAQIAAEDKALRHEKVSADSAAAKMLYEVMRDKRDQARKAYLAPLKRKIEELGSWLFNPSFRVEMNESDLSIATRTLDGVTVPFESLSGGTKEQISLIFRAACCILVASREGMPLILDDALGYTDTERLQLMGAVLAKAAKQCQIIIFTCVPERYANIGNARVVQL